MIREALKSCDDLIVVIGSAEESHTERNPFTAGERFQMIISSLRPNERSKIFVVPIRDVNRYSVWVNHLESYLPPFDVVFSNSDLTRSLFKQAGYEVRKTKAYNPTQFSATEIRQRIVSDEQWHDLVPLPVVSILEGIDAKGRLKDAGMISTRGGRCRAR